MIKPLDNCEKYTEYNDILQNPIQPLMNKLGAFQYEFFEEDTIKYQQYEKAILEALSDFKQTMKMCPINILIVGAGRGPLIKIAFKVAVLINIEIRITAIEKNPNTINTLMNLKFSQPLGKYLEILSVDIRKLKTEHKFDIILSELLGSFGDNELAPECLYGAQHLLAENGIYLPNYYCSYLRLMNCEKLWNYARTNFEKSEFPLEIPYVVKIKSASFIGNIQKVFEFKHPDYEKPNKTNEKYAEIIIKYEEKCENVIHGFAGYFSGTLYKDIKTSIVPTQETLGMNSWFPIYFPIKNPLLISQNDIIKINIWRCEDEINVWYEWEISIWNTDFSICKQTSSIHNSKGKSYYIGLH